MIIVTGGAGMIGSNIVATLNAEGHSDILVVDDLTDGHKIANLADLAIADYLDKDDFLAVLEADRLGSIDAVFHQGACSTTTEWNGKFMMDVNFAYSKRLLHACLGRTIPFLYASSASVYGGGSAFREEPQYERPLNVYAYSKKLFDDYVRRTVFGTEHSQVAGLRYFNVYGPREQHKGTMASVAFHLFNQVERGEKRPVRPRTPMFREIALPAELLQGETRFGFEGITSIGSGAEQTLWMAVQREWGTDEKGFVKLVSYKPESKEWGAVRYPLDKADKGWVGLSEITAHGARHEQVVADVEPAQLSGQPVQVGRAGAGDVVADQAEPHPAAGIGPYVLLKRGAHPT